MQVIKNGLYILKIISNKYSLSGKVICSGLQSRDARIEYENTMALNKKQSDYKGSNVEAIWQFNGGDRLKFTGKSGKYSTIVVDVPTECKTINYDFIECTDNDGNNYPIVKIGTQIWMAENLKTSRLIDCTIIPNVKDNIEWENLRRDLNPDPTRLGSPGCCWYNNDSTTYEKQYGKLYNYYAIETYKLCPIGWVVPSWSHFEILLSHCNYQTGKLKEVGFLNWRSPNIGATNETGFSGLPGGNRSSTGTFQGLGFWGACLSTTGAYMGQGAFALPLSYDQSEFDYASFPLNEKGSSIRCIKSSQLIVLPIITTQNVADIKLTTAKSGGNIIDKYGVAITVRGVCWSTSENPTIENAIDTTQNGSGIGTFESSLTGLLQNTNYYIRAYAINSKGTFYGDQVSFITNSPVETILFNPDLTYGSLSDIDGNTYKTIQIGNQTWMAENLKTTKYNNGNTIANVNDSIEWINLKTGAYCWYNNSADPYKNIYGALYNWYAVNTGNLCPTGWHVSSIDEWTILETYLNGSIVAGSKLKEMSFTHWINPNKGATNESGFTGLPGGQRSNGIFTNLGQFGLWWTSSRGLTNTFYLKFLNFTNISLGTWNMDKIEPNGFSVRCIKDDLTTVTPTVTTNIITEITSSSAKSGGNVSSDGGETVTERGICWSIKENPTIFDSKITSETGTVTFSCTITDLNWSTTYYVRAYAVNAVGVSYGEQQSFKTLPLTVNDADENVYTAVRIRNQIWLGQNLKTTKYNDGTPIPLITENSSWSALSTPAYCWLNNDITVYKDIYGALYNWYVVDGNSNGNKNVCPVGWHVPLDADWTDLTTSLVGESVAGGDRNINGTFAGVLVYGNLWPSTPSIPGNPSGGAWYRYVDYLNIKIERSKDDLRAGFSVRCVKD